MAIQHKLVLALIFFGSPYVPLLALYLTARYSAINIRIIVPWIRALRWLTWLTTGVLLLIGIVRPHFPYGFLSLGVSSGVMAIDLWAHARFPAHETK